MPRRLARWVVACLWLLVALMPLRAWAASAMPVSMADGPVAGADAGLSAQAPSVADLPPCHGGPGHDAPPDGAAGAGEHAACAQCLFCAPLLAATHASSPVQPQLAAPPRTGPAGSAPEGAIETLFRPPRR